MILAEGNTCRSAEHQEWKSTRVVHAGPWVLPPYKGIVEAEDWCTSPAHARIYVGVCSYMCACVWKDGGGVDGIAVPAGQLKYSAEVSIATAWDTRKP